MQAALAHQREGDIAPWPGGPWNQWPVRGTNAPGTGEPFHHQADAGRLADLYPSLGLVRRYGVVLHYVERGTACGGPVQPGSPACSLMRARSFWAWPALPPSGLCAVQRIRRLRSPRSLPAWLMMSPASWSSDLLQLALALFALGRGGAPPSAASGDRQLQGFTLGGHLHQRGGQVGKAVLSVRRSSMKRQRATSCTAFRRARALQAMVMTVVQFGCAWYAGSHVG